MSQQIFDQDRPRSTMAQRLDEAFAGCDEWTVVVAPRRRGRPDAESDSAENDPDGLPGWVTPGQVPHT